MSQHKRLYNSAAWKRLRLALLEREPLCRMCAATGHTTAATVADHVIPHRGDLELFFHGELQPLCATHHDGAKKRQEARGELIGGDTDGVPLDQSHHWNRKP